MLEGQSLENTMQSGILVVAEQTSVAVSAITVPSGVDSTVLRPSGGTDVGDCDSNSILTLIPLRFLPIKKEKINQTFVDENWNFISEIWPCLKDDSTGEFNSRQTHSMLLLRNLHDDTTETINRCYRDHLKKLAIKHKLTDITGTYLKDDSKIIEAALKRDGKTLYEYVKLAIEVVKKPIMNKRTWLQEVENYLQLKYKFRTEKEGRKSKSFVDDIAHAMLNGRTNQKFRRTMMKEIGSIWFERKTNKNKPLLHDKLGYNVNVVEMHGGHLASYKKAEGANLLQDMNAKIVESKANGMTKENMLGLIEDLYAGEQDDSKV